MKWDDVYWENTHLCDGKVHIGLFTEKNGQRMLALRLGDDGDTGKSITVLLDEDDADAVISDMKLTARGL